MIVPVEGEIKAILNNVPSLPTKSIYQPLGLKDKCKGFEGPKGSQVLAQRYCKF